MRARILVELIPAPLPTPRTSTATASPPSSRMSRPRSPTSPAALYPNRKFSPTTTTPAPISPTNTSRTNSSGLFLESSRSNGISTTSSAPQRKSISRRSPKGVSSMGGSPAPNTARGCGWKVAATTLMPLAPLLRPPASRPPCARGARRRSSRAQRLPRAKHHLGPPLFLVVPVHRQQLIPTYHPVTAV